MSFQWSGAWDAFLPENRFSYFLESSEGAAVVVAPGAALVSVLELSELGEVFWLESEGADMSFLLESCGTGDPGVAVLAEVAVVPEVVVASVVAGAGAVTVLVEAVESVAGAELLLLHPEKARGRVTNKAAMANLTLTNMGVIFMICFR
jgi:hypothetical protein